MLHNCTICDLSIPKKELVINCDERGLYAHPKCSIPKSEYIRLKNNGDQWYCSACWAPCALCNGDIFDGGQGLQCDFCKTWNHPLCCGIDEKMYAHFQNPKYGWMCPHCVVSRHENDFTDDDLKHVYNTYNYVSEEHFSHRRQHLQNWKTRPSSNSNSVSDWVTWKVTEFCSHELAKMSSLFSAFRKFFKLQNWYQNVLCCL